MYKKYRFFAFIPMLCMMSVIWGFSANNGEVSSNQSQGIIERTIAAVEEVFGVEWTDEQKNVIAERIHTPLRKCAHVTEYMVFAITTIFPLSLYVRSRKKLVLWTFVYCVLYAGIDELHQRFVPHRSGQFKDVCIDAIGIVIGIMVFLFVRKKVTDRKSVV